VTTLHCTALHWTAHGRNASDPPLKATSNTLSWLAAVAPCFTILQYCEYCNDREMGGLCQTRLWVTARWTRPRGNVYVCYGGNGVVYTRSAPRSYKKTRIGATNSVDSWQEFCVDRIRTREAEEPLLLEAVVRKRLVKTQQVGKGLAGAVVICELWRLATAL
jgi:hypothetical protein